MKAILLTLLMFSGDVDVVDPALVDDVSVNVKINPLFEHEPTYVVGELIELGANEAGEIRERDWQIEPPVARYRLSPDNKELYFSTPTPGTYTIDIVSVGKEMGLARDKIKIVVDFSDISKTMSKSGDEQDPATIVKDALAKVGETEADRDVEIQYVSDVILTSSSLPEAKAYCINQMGAPRFEVWQDFFKTLEDLMKSMSDDGLLPTPPHVRGALNEIAKAMTGA